MANARRLGAELLDERGRGVALRGAGRDEVDHGDPGRGARADRRADDLVEAMAALVEPRRELGCVGVDVGDHGDRVGAASREPFGEQRAPSLAHLRGAGQGAGVAVLEAGAQERQPEHDEHDGHERTDDNGAALHPAGEPVEAALDVVGPARAV